MGPPVVGADGRERDGQPKWFKPIYDVIGIAITMVFTNFGGMVCRGAVSHDCAR